MRGFERSSHSVKVGDSVESRNKTDNYRLD